MSAPVLSLHHVTATANDAQDDLDFYERTLGLRLVKKTVNFDNHNVFHFYYGDERGTPGTLWTTFPYRGHGVRVGTHGTGQITATSFSVPHDSQDFWAARLQERGYKVEVLPQRFGEPVLRVADSSGLAIELIATSRDQRTPWIAPSLSAATAIRGVHSVTLTVESRDATIEFMQHWLGASAVGDASHDHRVRVALRRDSPGHTLDIVEAPEEAPGVNGLGTVHHVAMAVATDDEQRDLRERLADAGVRVTDVLDRQYFKSIYFREPGGVLFEIATLGPGFLVDEPLDELGAGLKLPWWEEPSRVAIEAGLPQITR
jgi:glyoxalase family protein